MLFYYVRLIIARQNSRYATKTTTYLFCPITSLSFTKEPILDDNISTDDSNSNLRFFKKLKYYGTVKMFNVIM